jgi:phage major head subunit gpT-like protein
MIINGGNLRNLQTGFKANFQAGFAGVKPSYTRIATTVPSSTGSEDYGWLGAMPQMREWVGPRVVKNISEHGYTIRNREFELTISVPRPKIEDDQYGIYAPLMTEMGRSVAAHPDELVWGMLAAGFTTVCFDRQNFFDTDHPVVDPATGDTVSVSNVQAGAGAAWFLLDTTRAIKPIIFQQRKKPEFVAKTNPEDDRVFDRNEFVYGTYARHNVGFGFWQMAFASKAALTQANLRAARNAMMALTNDEGGKLGIVPDLLVVGVTNQDAARDIILAERLPNGATNTDRNLVEILVSPLLD